MKAHHGFLLSLKQHDSCICFPIQMWLFSCMYMVKLLYWFLCAHYKFTEAKNLFVNEHGIVLFPDKKTFFVIHPIHLRTPGLGQTGQEPCHSSSLILIAVLPPPEFRCVPTSDTEFVLNSENGRMERWEKSPLWLTLSIRVSGKGSWQES